MMLRKIIQKVPDYQDQEIAQIVHRVGVKSITLFMNEGTVIEFERTHDPADEED